MNPDLKESENIGKSIFRIDIRALSSPMIVAVSDKSENEIHEMVKNLRMKFVEACNDTFGDSWWMPTRLEHFLVTSLMHVDPCLTVQGQQDRMDATLKTEADEKKAKATKNPPRSINENKEGWWVIISPTAEQIVWAKGATAALKAATRITNRDRYSHFYGSMHPDGETEGPPDDHEEPSSGDEEE